MEEAKPFAIPKQAVWNAYKKVRANKGAAGIDEVSMDALLLAFRRGVEMAMNEYNGWRPESERDETLPEATSEEKLS